MAGDGVSWHLSTMLWFFLSIAVVAASPVGRAIADRLTGRGPEIEPDLENLRWMEERILELEDRLDMTERLLRRPAAPGDATEVGG